MPLATALTIASVAASAAGAGMSFAQSAKQAELQRKAERQAQDAMEAAKKKLEVNYYDKLSINKTPYQLEQEAMLAAGAQAMEGAREGGRGAAETAGRIQMAQNQGQAQIAESMNKDLQSLEQLSATEDARLASANANINLNEATGAQQAASYYDQASDKALQEGFAGVTSVLKTGAELVPLFAKTATPTQMAMKGLAGGAMGAVSGENVQPTATAPFTYVPGQFGYGMNLNNQPLPAVTGNDFLMGSGYNPNRNFGVKW